MLKFFQKLMIGQFFLLQCFILFFGSCHSGLSDNSTSFNVNDDFSLISSSIINKSREIQAKIEKSDPFLLLNISKTKNKEKEKEENFEDDYFDIPDYSDTVSHVNESIELIQNWSKKSNILLNMISTALIPFAFQVGTESDLSPQCISSLLQFGKGIKNQKSWATRVIDSYGRLSPGFLSGTITSFGEFKECISINFPKQSTGLEAVGKYCVLRLNFPMPAKPKHLKVSKSVINLSGSKLEGTIWDSWTRDFNFLYSTKGFRFGVCIPSTCSSEEIEAVIKQIAEPIIQIPIYLDQDHECSTRLDSLSLNTYSVISLIIFGTSISLVLVSTCFEIYLTHKFQEKLFSKVNTDLLNFFQKSILTFSIISNTRKLFKAESPEKSYLSSFHGIQVLSLFWIIIGHTYSYGTIYEILFTLKRLTKDLSQHREKVGYQALTNTFLIADSLFFLSGLMVVSITLPVLQKRKQRFNFLAYALHYWIRLVSVSVGLTLFYFLFPFLNSGPIYKHKSNIMVQNCENNFWYNLYGIGNWFFPFEKMCASELWLVEAEFQLLLLAPIIFLSYCKSQKFGYFVNIIFIGLGVIASGLTSYLEKSSPAFGIDHIIDPEYLRYQVHVAHFPTYHHIAPFGIGILLGYLLIKHRENLQVWSIPQNIKIIFWILLPLASIAIMFLTYAWNIIQESVDVNQIIQVLFSAFQRPIWCLGLAWILFCCVTGKSRILNNLLSYHGFIPLSRLSLCIYVTHLVPIYLRAYSIKYTMPWDEYYFISWSVFNIILSVVAAYLLYILFESPFYSIEKLVLGSRKTWKPKMNSHDTILCEKFSQEKIEVVTIENYCGKDFGFTSDHIIEIAKGKKNFIKKEKISQ